MLSRTTSHRPAPAWVARAWTAGTSRCVLLLASLLSPAALPGQVPNHPITALGTAGAAALDSLVAVALATNPRIHAAHAQMEVARARVAPAATLPDPMLGVGLMNVPVTEPGFADFMTMKTITLGQRLPYPGKLELARRAAEHEAVAAVAGLEATRLEVAAEVRAAYYEIAFLDRAAELVERGQRLVVEMIQAAESRYAVGAGDQSDVLGSRIEASFLAEEAVAVAETRRAAVARFNALLGQPTDMPMPDAAVPERIARAAVAEDPARIRFASSMPGARVTESPVPSLAELQAMAVRNSPALRAHEAEIAAQAARLELASRAHLPDFDVSLQYGQRDHRTDMASVMVSVPLPVHRRTRQAEGVAEARAQLAMMQAGHHEMVDRLNADVAALHAKLERHRSQLALFVASVLPQGRAAVESAQASFRVGSGEFAGLLESEKALYDYERLVHRGIADFAMTLAELARIVGSEVLR